MALGNFNLEFPNVERAPNSLLAERVQARSNLEVRSTNLINEKWYSEFQRTENLAFQIVNFFFKFSTVER